MSTVEPRIAPPTHTQPVFLYPAFLLLVPHLLNKCTTGSKQATMKAGTIQT